MTKVKNSPFILFILFIWLLSSIMDKLKWNFIGWNCDFFTITTFIVFFILVINRLSMKFDAYANKFLVLYCISILYTLFSFLLLNQGSIFFVQHMKGLVSNIIEIIAFFNILFFSRALKGSRASLLYRFIFIIGIINATYCYIQLLYPNIDQVLVNIFHSDTVRSGTDSYGKIERVSGFLLESNFNGPFLVLTMISGIFLLNEKKYSSRKKFCVFMMISYIGVAMFLTFSRTAYLGFAVYLMILFFQINNRRKIELIFCFIVIVIIGLVILNTNESIAEVVYTRFSFLNGSSSLKEDSHFRILKEALTIIFSNIKNVFFGVGKNCLYLYFRDMFGYVTQNMKAHNHYVQIWGESGIIGLILFGSYILLLLKAKSLNTEKKYLKTILFCFLAMNFTYDPFTRSYTIIFEALAVFMNRDFMEFTRGIIYKKNNCSRWFIDSNLYCDNF